MPKIPSPESNAETEAAPGKGRATPKRREREAENQRPLVPTDRRLAARENRARMQAAREKSREGLAKGEERYLPARDKGPQRRFVRDFVDARFSLGEILMPLLVVVILTYFLPAIAEIALLGVWAYILAVVVDSVVLGVQVRKRLAAKFGATKVERGVRWYAAMRAMQMRPLRLPKPQVKRGQWPS